MIDPRTTIGEVYLTISDLDRSVRFYEAHLGLTTHDVGPAQAGPHVARTARLGAAGGSDLIVLEESPSAPRVQGTTGLYHFAILVPARADLARAFRRLVDTRTLMQGAADHGVSEALYLADPDGNGIEMYRDRPRAEWPMVDGHLHMGVEPLDLEALLAESSSPGSPGCPEGLRYESSEGLAAGTVMGHVHLHVAAIDASRQFYVDVLGFELMQRYGPSALFVSAGGYHHHIGLNTWAGVGAPPAPVGAIGLKHFVVRMADASAVDEVAGRVRTAGISVEVSDAGVCVRDPSGNSIRFESN